jgi:5-amino-6-(5-phosphoribosylamino)uracil reductase
MRAYYKHQEICVANRPYVVLSVAASIDGYIDDTTDQRLLLSNDEDFDRVDEVRASVDAILVGANTIRRDDPRLLVRSPDRRVRRTAKGLTESPIKVTITATGNLDPSSKFFTTGDVDKIVYTSEPGKTTSAIGASAITVDAGDPVDLGFLLDDLGRRGLTRLMVEGGTTLHTQFLANDLADELHLVVAPFFVGDTNAPAFVSPGTFPHNRSNRMRLGSVEQIGDVVLLRYLLKGRSDD